MAVRCPIKTDKAWEHLVSSIGEINAFKVFLANDEYTPDLDQAKKIASSWNTQETVNANLKVLNQLTKPGAQSIIDKGIKNKWEWWKIGEALGIPKLQIPFLQESYEKGNKSTSDLITDILANNSYAVKINITKHEIRRQEYNSAVSDEEFAKAEKEHIKGGYNEETGEYNYQVEKPFSEYHPITYEPGDEVWYSNEQFDKYIKIIPKNKKSDSPSQVYSNMAVPGGTNYTENEISTPLITPSIKGHAQFSTPNGIGWFRSDEATKGAKWFLDDVPVPEWEMEKKGVHVTKEGIPTKTLRILEVQSDLFQRGRNLQTIVGKENPETYSRHELAEIYGGGTEGIQEYEKDIKEFNQNTKNLRQNKFLQLLNKDNNWITFFIKSIIQNSAKKDYESVLFPTGNTASKVEGHTTLEEFKKQKEDRIKELKKLKSKDNDQPEYIYYDEVGQPHQEIVSDSIDKLDKELIQLKQELERVEKEGFAALKPIFKFYEETVFNILKKNYEVQKITDEYNNTWYKVDLSKERDLKDIYFGINPKDIQEEKQKWTLKDQNTTDTKILQELGLQDTPVTSLEAITRTISDKLTLDLSNKVKLFNPGLKIELTVDKSRYDSKANTIYLDLAEIKAISELNSSKYDLKSTFLFVLNHELVHSITAEAIHESPEAIVTELEELHKEFMQRTDTESFKDTARRAEGYRTPEGKQYVSDIQEFAADFASNREFREHIRNLDKGLFQKIIDWFKKLFGYTSTYKSDLFKKLEDLFNDYFYKLNQDTLELSKQTNAEGITVRAQKEDPEGTVKTDEVKTKLTQVIKDTIQSLTSRLKELKQSKTPSNTIEINKRLHIISTSLKKLVEKGTPEALIQVANIDLKSAEDIMSKETPDDKDLREVMRITFGIESFDKTLAGEDLNEDIIKSLASIRTRNNNIYAKFNKYIKNFLVETAKKQGFNLTEQELFKITKDFYGPAAHTLSPDISHIPLLKVFEDVISTNASITNSENFNEKKDYSEMRSKYTKEQEDELFEDGSLINPYSKKFFETEYKTLIELSETLKDKKKGTLDKAKAFQKVFTWYKENVDYTLTPEKRAEYNDLYKAIQDANPDDPSAIQAWESENSPFYIGSYDANGKLTFSEDRVPKINGIVNRNWYSWLSAVPKSNPELGYLNKKYDKVKDNELYKFILDKYIQAKSKVPGKITLSRGEWYRSISEVTNQVLDSKFNLNNTFNGLKDTGLSWFTVKPTLEEASGEDSKLLDERGRPKPNIQAQTLQGIQDKIKPKRVLDLMEEYSKMANEYSHFRSVQPVLDLLTYAVEEQPAIKTNFFGSTLYNLTRNSDGSIIKTPIHEQGGLKQAVQAMRFRSTSYLSKTSKTDESAGTQKLTSKEISDLQKMRELEAKGELTDEKRRELEVHKFSGVKTVDTLIDYTRMNLIGITKPFSALFNLTMGMINNSIYAAKNREFTDDDLFWATRHLFGSINKFYTSWVSKKLITPEAEKIANLIDKFGITDHSYEAQDADTIKKGKNWVVKKIYALQEGGEYLIKTQLMLSLLNNTKIKNLKGEQKTLFQAFNTDGTFNTKEFGEHPEWEKYNLLDTNQVNISEIKKLKDTLNRIRKNSQGDYGTAMQFKGKWWGRVLMMFRTWLPRAIYDRYGAENGDFKGRYRSGFSIFEKSPGVQGILSTALRSTLNLAFRSINLPILGRLGLNKLEKLNSENYEKYLKDIGASELDIQNMRANLRELQYLMYCVFLVSLIASGGDDDPEMNLLSNISMRTAQDLSFFILPSSTFAVIKNPIPLTHTLLNGSDVLFAGYSLLTDANSDTYKAGRHKGESKFLEKSKELLPFYAGINSTLNTLDQRYGYLSSRYTTK